MARNTKDYIPTLTESTAEYEKRMEYMKNTPDPRHSYKAVYTINNQLYSEIVMAYNADEAEKHVKQQCSMVGIYPYDLKIEEA